MKVQELSKILGTSVKELIKFLTEMNIKVKSGSTKLSPGLVNEIKTLFKGETPEPMDGEIVEVTLETPTIVLQDFAKLLKVNLGELMKAVLLKGLALNLNSEIDAELAQGLASDLKIKLIVPDKNAHADQAVKESMTNLETEDVVENEADLVERPPVITIMGHVDHGKTQLLDTIRSANVVAKEAGGITQHIGAYQVKVGEKYLTFLDTPGHEAFTALRARGAQVTDIVIIVVAADEGLKPQTIEAINHAKAANVPIIVAINKIDKPNANEEMVKQQLGQHELVPEDWGGTTVTVPISAKNNQNIDTLLEMLTLTAEMLELRASNKRDARAVVVESRLSRKKGPIATVLVKTGTLKVGDYFTIENQVGKIRALITDTGESIKAAPPGMPVEILGVSAVPAPGGLLEVFPTEKACKKHAETFEKTATDHTIMKAVSLETIGKLTGEEENKTLNLIVKADVHGSLEAIVASIKQIPSEDIAINVIHASTGEITENDIMLASASSAIVIGFNIDIRGVAQKCAEDKGIQFKLYKVIYEIIEDLEKAIKGLFTPEFEEVELGVVEVRELFKFSKVGVIAGSYVLSGKIFRNVQARVMRNGKEIYAGKVDSLKRFKDDIKEVAKGFECGVVMDNFNTFEPGDQIVCFTIQEKHTTL